MAKRSGLQARSSSIKAALTADRESGKSAGKEPLKLHSKPADGKLIGLTVRLQPEIHDRLRRIAFEQRVSIHSLLLEGLDVILKKHEG